MESPPTKIGIAVVEHDGCYLVGVRADDRPLAGLAEFPGGKCEAEETTAECAVRECLEETGLAVLVQKLLLHRQFHYAHGEVDLHFWLCRPKVQQRIEAGHNGFRWIPANRISELQFPDANAPVIEMLIARSSTHA